MPDLHHLRSVTGLNFRNRIDANQSEAPAGSIRFSFFLVLLLFLSHPASTFYERPDGPELLSIFRAIKKERKNSFLDKEMFRIVA